MTKVQKSAVVYKDNQGAIFLARNRQVGMCAKHIDIRHHFLRDVKEVKDMVIKYIKSKEKYADIMTNNFSGDDYVKHTKRITEGELW